MTDKLNKQRCKLNNIDRELLDCLSRRFKVIEDVSRIKLIENIDVMQPGRVDSVISRNKEIGKKGGLSDDFIEKIYKLIIEEACRVEYLYIKKNKL